MDPKLLDLPLAVKIPQLPRIKTVWSRGKIGEELCQPLPFFTLDDPYNHHLSIAYNCLHDPILRDYHTRKDVLKLLKRQGLVTSDNKAGLVVCTLKEFNEYRQYLTRQKLQAEQELRCQEASYNPSAHQTGGKTQGFGQHRSSETTDVIEQSLLALPEVNQIFLVLTGQ
ncbi:hypothetical protein WISP_103296 [Willisornis vidua]|uniref:SAP domain-containing protein n=1 Tax=Willisornis vidua TaxID=1566151 RepID=A0ABQ9CXR0_9PASS|nr:hypothetical protein WISP_103296 [Willisornis vidua]